MLLGTLDVEVFECSFNVVDVLLWHHGVTETRIELQKGRLDANILLTILELQTLQGQRPAFFSQFDPLNIIVLSIIDSKLLEIVATHDNRPRLICVLR